MILRRLAVRNFAGLNPGATISSFSPSITVVQGPNGSGKSTLMRALTFALYQRHGITSADARAQIVPVGADVAPSVELDFESAGETWRIAKRFFKGPRSELFRLRGGQFEAVADGEAADARVRDLVGAAIPGRGLADASLRGIGEILLADQGRLRFDGALGEPARRTLRDIIHDVSTTSDAQAVIDEVRRRWSAIFTPKGEKVRGKNAAPEVATASELETARTDLAQVKAQLTEAQAIEDELSGLAAQVEAVEEERARRLADAERSDADLHEWVRRSAALESLTKSAARTAVDAEDLRRRCAAIAAARLRLAELEKARESREQRHRDAERALALAQQAWNVADELARIPDAHRAELEKLDASVADAQECRTRGADLAALTERLERFDALAREAADLVARLAAQTRPARTELERLRATLEQIARLDARLDAVRLRIRLTAHRDLTVDDGSGARAVPAGGTLEITGDDLLRAELAGIASIDVTGPASSDREAWRGERDRLNREFEIVAAPFGTRDRLILERLADERHDLERRLADLDGRRALVFKSESEANAARERGRSNSDVIRSLVARNEDWLGVAPGEVEVADLRRRRDRLAQVVSTADARRRERVDEARATLDRCRTDRELTSSELAQADLKLHETRRELEILTNDGREDATRDDAARRLADEARRLADDVRLRQQELETLGDPQARMKQSKGAIDAIDGRLSQARRRHAELAGRLDGIRARGLWSKAGELEESVTLLEGRLRDQQAEAAALDLLHRTLEEELQLGIERVVEPVRVKLERLVRHTFGQRMAVPLGEGLVPDRVADEQGRTLSLDQLSAGAADQLALLARIGIGEVYAERAGRHALVLDDPLVNADRERRLRILDILVGALSHLQIVIFTCHPEHYAGLPADRTEWIEVASARRALADGADAR